MGLRCLAIGLVLAIGVLAVGVRAVAVGGAEAAGTRGVSVKLRASEARDAAVLEEVRLYAKSHALVIGIDSYSAGWPRLAQARADARRVAAALTAQGFEVTLKLDLGSNELARAFEDFFIDKGGDPEARLFVWFAGHGHTADGEGFLIPADGAPPGERGRFLRSAISLRDFGKFVRLAEAKHVFTIFDSCFSGTIFSAARSAPPPHITRVTAEPVRQFLTSGDAGQIVADDGTFASLFVEALAGKRRADLNGDGYLTASELGAFLDNNVSNLTRNRQTPRYGKLRDARFDRGDFVFEVAAASPQPSSASTPGQAHGGGASPEIVFWQSIQNSRDAADFEAYLAQFPKGTFAALARNRIAGLRRGTQQAAAIAPARPAAAPPVAAPAVGTFRPAARAPDCTTAELVVPYAPGGATDTTSRLVAGTLVEQQALRFPLVISNHAGAGGVVGARRVRGARPDGCTLLALPSGLASASVEGHAEFGPDAFEPVARLASTPVVLAVAANGGIASLAAFVAEARRTPGGLNVGVVPGTPGELAMQAFESLGGIRLRLVSYKSNIDLIQALTGGHLHAGASVAQGTGPLKALAVAGERRLPAKPDVPTFRESGYEVVFGTEYGIVLPAGTAAEVTRYWAEALAGAAGHSKVADQLARWGMEVAVLPPDAYRRHLNESFEIARRLAQQSGRYKRKD